MSKKRKENTNFRLGLNRQELIDAAQLFGKSLKTAKRDSTKRLEEYLSNKLGGRGTKVPNFTDREKRDIKDSTNDFGLQHGLHLLAWRISKVSGNQDENNYLRLTIGRAFSAYYDKGVEKRHIDELISRLPKLEYDEIISGLREHKAYYQDLLLEYVDELNS